MPEIKVNRDTKVVLQLTEDEAGKIKSVLLDHVDFDREPWAHEIVTALNESDVHTQEYVDA